MNQDTILVMGLSVNTLAVIGIAWRGGIMLGTVLEKLATLTFEVNRLRDALDRDHQMVNKSERA